MMRKVKTNSKRGKDISQYEVKYEFAEEVLTKIGHLYTKTQEVQRRAKKLLFDSFHNF